ncbi:MAG TPA: metallophosphoesterase [Polyangia bacterium]
MIVAALGGCLDPAAERTRRDFDEVGRAALGTIEARIDQGTALRLDAAARFVRFRANAPTVTITLRSSDAAPQRVALEVANVAAGSTASPAAELRDAGHNAVAFDLDVPPGGAAAVTIAAPGADLPAPFAFAWVGDVQGGLADFARVRARIDADPALELVVFAGDVTQNGTAAQLDDFVAAADLLARPWYTVVGNHEGFDGSMAEFQRRIGRLNTTFDYRGARFLLVDSAASTIDPRARDFMAGALGPAGPALRVAGMHVPPLDWAGLRDGGFASRLEAAAVLAQLATGGVDLLLAGHIHSLHQGREAGIETVVSGNGGVSATPDLDGVGVHYLAISADPAREELAIAVVTP